METTNYTMGLARKWSERLKNTPGVTDINWVDVSLADVSAKGLRKANRTREKLEENLKAIKTLATSGKADDCDKVVLRSFYRQYLRLLMEMREGILCVEDALERLRERD